MTELYKAISLDIRRLDIELAKISRKRKTADDIFKRKLDKMEHELSAIELPRLKRIAFNIRTKGI